MTLRYQAWNQQQRTAMPFGGIAIEKCWMRYRLVFNFICVHTFMQYPNVPDQSRESFLIALGSSGNEFPFAALEIVGANRFHRRPHGRWDNGRCMELNFMTCSVKSSLLAFGFYRVLILNIWCFAPDLGTCQDIWGQVYASGGLSTSRSSPSLREDGPTYLIPSLGGHGGAPHGSWCRLLACFKVYLSNQVEHCRWNNRTPG